MTADQFDDPNAKTLEDPYTNGYLPSSSSSTLQALLWEHWLLEVGGTSHLDICQGGAAHSFVHERRQKYTSPKTYIFGDEICSSAIIWNKSLSLIHI